MSKFRLIKRWMVILAALCFIAPQVMGFHADTKLVPPSYDSITRQLHPPTISPFQLRYQSIQGKACPPIKDVKCQGYLIRHAGRVCPLQPTCCGDMVCDDGENGANCPRDCPGNVEPKQGCPKAERPACKGRLIFEVQPAGGCPRPPVCCGDGSCQSIESARACPEDCASFKSRKEKQYCPEIAVPRCHGFLIYPKNPRGTCVEAPSCCGDGRCDKVESSLECPKDCGSSSIDGASQAFRQKLKNRYRDQTAVFRGLQKPESS